MWNTLLPAVFGVLGAGVGAAGAVWGAKRAADTALQQTHKQHEFERERWRRDQRQQAYVTFLEAVDPLIDLLEKLAFGSQQLDPHLLPDDDWQQTASGTKAVIRATERIRLTGPTSVAGPAVDLRFHLLGMQYALRPDDTEPLADRLQEYRTNQISMRAKYLAFRREAQIALDFQEPSE